ncbi:MAG: hypothetical protein V3U24_04035 [Candidatus Neomarinimicrobiota bacterium]
MAEDKSPVNNLISHLRPRPVARLSVTFLFVAVTAVSGQFKYSAGLGLGVIYPDYSQFNDSIKDSLDKKVGPLWLPFGYDISVQVYPSVRLGYFRLSNALIPEKSSDDFVLIMLMRGISIQTFFTFFRRFEANFGFALLLGKAEFIQQNIEAPSSHFQFSATTRAGTRNGNSALYTWTGVRYYIGTFLAVEANLGYLRGKFKGDKWTNGGDEEAVFGTINLSKPAFRFGIIFGW